MADSIERDYKMEDLLMLQMAQVIHNAFVLDQAAFAADFPALATPFNIQFQTAIDNADAIPSAEEVDGQIVAITDELNSLLPLGQKALQKLYTYVEMAFTNPGKQAEFGRPRYEKARNSQLQMKELLETANRIASVASNKAALMAVGYTQAAIDELKSISDDIDDLNSQQEDMLSSRITKTQARIVAYNLVWGFLKTINKASKVTFVDDPAKLEIYMLYPTSGGGVPTKVQNLNYDMGNTKLKWDEAGGADRYQLEMKRDAVGFDWTTIYEGVQNEFVYVPQSGNWLFRCRGINSNGSGSWSDELIVVQP